MHLNSLDITSNESSTNTPPYFSFELDEEHRLAIRAKRTRTLEIKSKDTRQITTLSIGIYPDKKETGIYSVHVNVMNSNTDVRFIVLSKEKRYTRERFVEIVDILDDCEGLDIGHAYTLTDVLLKTIRPFLENYCEYFVECLEDKTLVEGIIDSLTDKDIMFKQLARLDLFHQQLPNVSNYQIDQLPTTLSNIDFSRKVTHARNTCAPRVPITLGKGSMVADYVEDAIFTEYSLKINRFFEPVFQLIDLVQYAFQNGWNVPSACDIQFIVKSSERVGACIDINAFNLHINAFKVRTNRISNTFYMDGNLLYERKYDIWSINQEVRHQISRPDLIRRFTADFPVFLEYSLISTNMHDILTSLTSSWKPADYEASDRKLWNDHVFRRGLRKFIRENNSNHPTRYSNIGQTLPSLQHIDVAPTYVASFEEIWKTHATDSEDPEVYLLNVINSGRISTMTTEQFWRLASPLVSVRPDGSSPIMYPSLLSYLHAWDEINDAILYFVGRIGNFLKTCKIDTLECDWKMTMHDLDTGDAQIICIRSPSRKSSHDDCSLKIVATNDFELETSAQMFTDQDDVHQHRAALKDFLINSQVRKISHKYRFTYETSLGSIVQQINQPQSRFEQKKFNEQLHSHDIVEEYIDIVIKMSIPILIDELNGMQQHI